MKILYWMVKEATPLSKLGSLLHLLKNLECPYVGNMSVGENATYTSLTASNDMVEAMAESLRQGVYDKVRASPAVSLLADESTDITVSKKLVVYARILCPETFMPSTHFLASINLKSGTGEAIAAEITRYMESKVLVPMKNVSGFGSDGASVMTGRKKGVTGQLLRQNPAMINVHCVAHRLALCSSQAANSVEYLKSYQAVITGLFYHFKRSATRVENVKEIQDLLNEPQLKYTEVHQVRWLSFYKAVETIYRTVGSLITYFAQQEEPQAKGYAKKMAQYEFIATTYMMMDILPIVTKLALIFQKRDLDVALVPVSVKHCLDELDQHLKQTVQHETHLKKLPNELTALGGCRYEFKGHNVTVTPNQRKHFLSIASEFVTQLMENIKQRFPQSQTDLLSAFGVLSMRPISFLNGNDLKEWGNDKIEALLGHFGKEIQHETTVSTPLVDPTKTREEWGMIKPVVIQEGYPRDNTATLWSLIRQYHEESFPNLLKLSAIAIVLPVHTSDCERGFSLQNRIKVPLRNRISDEALDNQIMIVCEGKTLEAFDFRKAVGEWKAAKNRRLFKE